jgi:hypothetical protein
MMLGLLTVGLFLFFGLTFLESNRMLAWAFFALATLRLVVWIRVLSRVLANRSEDRENRPPPQEPAPWPEDEVSE